MRGAHRAQQLFYHEHESELDARPRKFDVCNICGGPWANVYTHKNNGDLLCEHGVTIGWRKSPARREE